MPSYSPNFLSVAVSGRTMVNAVSIPPNPGSVNLLSIPVINNIGQFNLMVNAVSRGRAYTPFPIVVFPVVWGTWVFGPGYVGHPYLEQWFLENVQQPVVFTLYSGDLPPGLQLSTSGITARGQIAGTPTEAGTFNFVLLATGPSSSATKGFNIIVTEIDVPAVRRGTAYVGGN